MTLKDFGDLLATSGLPVTYLAFPADDCPEMPFITFQEVGSNNFSADGKSSNASGQCKWISSQGIRTKPQSRHWKTHLVIIFGTNIKPSKTMKIVKDTHMK